MDFATDPERLKGVLYWAGVAIFLGIELRGSHRVACSTTRASGIASNFTVSV